jgi:hypothetical protein
MMGHTKIFRLRSLTLTSLRDDSLLMFNND